ncbi:MAG TPA: GGDEF domain-containing phosphodiesterase [Chondromyces sp.]|nr:GGDEF domain-containing phosphodiesterase [Chondromyces sp.]
MEVLSHPFWIANQEAYITSSIGISFFPEDGTTIESLLRNADKAMYVAKKQGRNRFAVYHDDLRGPSAELLTIETQLRKAIEREELYLAYQPQISLDTNEIEGIEALIRWNNEILGHIPPGDFIPLAEETGLIIPIGEWVVKQACNDLKKLHLLGFEQLRCAINISPLQFMQEQFVENLVQIAENENIPARMIELELTESTIMPNANHSIQRLVALKKHGFKLSVDDFGTGYSSLSYLSRFPLDYLKIDRSFIKSIDAFDEDSSIVEAILTMAHRLNLRVIAEGVENVKQLRFLRKENCDIVQGFYFSKPKSIDELIDFLYMWDTNWAN